MSKKTIAVIGLFVLLVILSGIVLFNYLSAQKLQKAYGETLTTMCVEIDPEWASPPSLDRMPRFVIFEKGTLHEYHRELPDDWRADGEDEVDLVICVEPSEDVEAQGCDYPGGETVRRFQSAWKVYALNPQKAGVVAWTTLAGELPECPPTAGSSEVETGPPPDLDTLLRWLETLQ